MTKSGQDNIWCGRYEVVSVNFAKAPQMGQISGMGARGLELEKVSQMHRLMQLMAAGMQNYFAISDFSARYSGTDWHI